MPVAIDLPRKRIHLSGDLQENYWWLKHAWICNFYGLQYLMFPVAVVSDNNGNMTIDSINENWTVEGEFSKAVE